MSKYTTIKLRKRALQSLIDSTPIENQQTLVELLAKRYGIATNQAVVSRDLRDMGVTKRSMGDKLIYETSSIDASREILRLGVVDVVHNQFQIVIKTIPGLAAFVGDFIDIQEDIGVMGTLAGENVLFVSPADCKNIEAVYKKLCTLLHVKK